VKRLYLVRHGETPWNAERRLQGRKDIALSPQGRRQAAALRSTVDGLVAGHRAAGDAPLTVVASPLRRAAETCALLEREPDLLDARWQEADLGEWTGRSRDDLIAVGDGAYAAWRAGTLSPPGSEPLSALRQRVASALESLAAHDVVLVVTHGGPIRAACRQLVDLHPSHLVPVQPGSLTAIDLDGGQARLRTYNLTPQTTGQLLGEPPD